MPESQTEEQFFSKRDEVISKFRKEFFTEYYNLDPVFRAVAEMLFRNKDPYAIIEELIIDRKRIADDILKVKEYHAFPIIGKKLNQS